MELNDLKDGLQAFAEANDTELTFTVTRSGILIYNMAIRNSAFAGISPKTNKVTIWYSSEPKLRNNQRLVLAWALLHGYPVNNHMSGLTD
ncbi:hypothetical protein VPHD472_0101 [Vibrio phage D472]